MLFTSLRGYQRARIPRDLIAGATVWAVLVPESLAYATIAGVSPEVGLYAAPSALLFYAAFGSSRHLVVGPMSATAALSAAAVGSVVGQNHGQFAALTATLAITVGVIAIVFGLARLGFIANFISEPVLKGFIIGLAMTIMIGQVPKLFGVSKGTGDFFNQLWHILTELGKTNVATFIVGASSLSVLLLLRRFAEWIPGSLVVVLAGIVVAEVAHLGTHGVELVGPIPSGLPHYGFPHVASGSYLALSGSAVGIVLVGFAEGLGAAKTYAAREGYDVDANRELIGLGAASAAAGLSSGMVVNGSLSKTAVNGGAGATSQVSGLAAAVLTVLTLVFLTGLFKELPEATLAAVVIAAVLELVDVAALRRLWRSVSGPLQDIHGLAARADFIAAMAALLGVMVFDTLPGLFIGIAMSVVLLAFRASRPYVAELGLDPAQPDRYVDRSRVASAASPPGVVVLRIEGPLFFANADGVEMAVRAAANRPGTSAVVVDASAVGSVDFTAADMLHGLAERLERSGVRLVFARAIWQVEELLSAAGTDSRTLEVYRTIHAAVAACSGEPEPDSSER